jgi:hypothetical protein
MTNNETRTSVNSMIVYAEKSFDGVTDINVALSNGDKIEMQTEYRNSPEGMLLGKLETAVDDYKNIGQSLATSVENSTREAMKKVPEFDAEIGAAAAKFGVEKELVQSVLFQEIRFFSPQDTIADAIAQQSFRFEREFELWDSYPNSIKGMIPVPTALPVYNIDVSTGLGQIKPSTAIDAFQWCTRQESLKSSNPEPRAIEFNKKNWKDAEPVWTKLHNDDTYNIDTTALVLAYKRDILTNKDTPKEKVSPQNIMQSYNGSGDWAVKYGAVTNEYYKAFKEYNERGNCRGNERTNNHTRDRKPMSRSSLKRMGSRR